MTIIRPAEAADADAVYSLAVALATSFVVEEQAFRFSFGKVLDASDACLFVAEVDNVVVGYVLAFDHYAFYANGRVTWVEEIMVSDAFRRQGIGQSLMQAVEAWAAERGSKLVGLATRRAAPFYQALGYEESAAYFRKKLPPERRGD